MDQCKIIYLLYIFAFHSLSLNLSYAKEDYIRIPVSISPLVQHPIIKLTGEASLMYKTDKDFYSKVTALDVARNEENDISETIKKSIQVVFLIAASSHISGTLTRKKLVYLKKGSKWSYKVPVKELLRESNENIQNINEKTQLYKIQELAMKVLARRYGFTVDFILQRHRMSLMEFYAADEDQWVRIVGTITEIVIKNVSVELNLTPCYLAELINKTHEDMDEFSLEEVDMYLMNVSAHKEKLPAHRNKTLRSFYHAFNITPAQLAKISNVNMSEITIMGVKDTISLFMRTILQRFHISVFPSDAIPINEAICRSQWNDFRSLILTEAFDKQAREMSITPKTLGNLIGIPDEDIDRLSPMKMIYLIEVLIKPVKQDLRKIEKFTISMLKEIYSSKRLNTEKHNAISLIKRSTKFGKRALKVLYGWTTHDCHFARLFSVKDLGDECSIDLNEKTLLSLAKINVGQLSKDINCTAFHRLRLVWGQASLNDLTRFYYPNTRISLDEPIAAIVGRLTNSSVKMSSRVLSKTRIIQWLLQKITLNNISEMTNYTDIYLQEIPIQRIILMVHELYNAGSFDLFIQVSSYHIYYIDQNLLILISALTSGTH